VKAISALLGVMLSPKVISLRADPEEEPLVAPLLAAIGLIPLVSLTIENSLIIGRKVVLILPRE
jgi:hypothetical protein